MRYPFISSVNKIDELKQKNMHTQVNKKETGNRKKYQTPVVEKIQIDTEFTYFTTSQDPVPTNPGQNSIVFNPFKFFK